MFPRVAIIILNWNGWKDTIECLESLYKINYLNYDVILIDNDSKDESIEKIWEYCSGGMEVNSKFFKYSNKNKPIKVFEISEDEARNNKVLNKDEYEKLNSNNRMILIKNKDNYGFTGGNNIGIRYALKNLNSNYILLLNNDTVVDPQFLNILVKEAQDDNVGILGPNVYYYSDPDRIVYIGGNINYYTGKITHPYFNEIKNDLNISEIDYISGCSLLIKREVIEEVGLLNNQYFLYYEDTDWCLRAKNKGFKIIHAPEAKVWHKVLDSIERNSIIALYYGVRNQFLLIRKNGKNRHKLIFFPYFTLSKIALLILFLVTNNKNKFFTVITAIKDVIKGNYGYKNIKY